MSSNTAERWWVRLAARWLARVDGVSGQIRVFSLGVTAFSTFSLVLQNSGHGEFVVPLGVIGLIVSPIYTYFYAEKGVWNQVQRDKTDMSTNYSGPVMLMDDALIGIGMFYAVHGRPPTDEELDELEGAVKQQWEEYRTGVDIDYDG